MIDDEKKNEKVSNKNNRKSLIENPPYSFLPLYCLHSLLSLFLIYNFRYLPRSNQFCSRSSDLPGSIS